MAGGAPLLVQLAETVQADAGLGGQGIKGSRIQIRRELEKLEVGGVNLGWEIQFVNERVHPLLQVSCDVWINRMLACALGDAGLRDFASEWGGARPLAAGARTLRLRVAGVARVIAPEADARAHKIQR